MADPPSSTPGLMRYGVEIPPTASPLDVELWAFRTGRTVEQGGLGKAEHFFNVVRALWPEGSSRPVVVHPWFEDMTHAACENQYVGLAGAGSSGKTDWMSIWGIVNFLCSPHNTMVLATSTSLKEARKRVWGSIREYWLAVPGLPGRLVDSVGIIRFDDGTGNNPLSDKSGISLIAGEKKKEKEAIGKLIGLKNARVILLADELSELSEALLEAAYSNLSLNPYFQMIAASNPASYYDPFGLFVKPKLGWTSVSVDDEEWETERGVCLHFDGLKSPNFDHETDIYPIYGRKQLAEHKQLSEKSLAFWRMCRGFFSPSGSEQTVYSDADLIHAKADEPAVWEGETVKVAALDPGFTNGGDRSILYFGEVGTTDKGLRTLMFTDYVELFDDITDREKPRGFQIAEQFRDHCVQRKIKPEHAAADSTGAGGPFMDIVHQVWSPQVLRVNFGGKASDARASEFQRDAAAQKYSNRVSEIWFSGQELLQTGQLKGVCPALAREMCARYYTTEKGAGDIRLRVESKQDMKRRTNGVSPDLADAAFILVMLCFERLKLRPGSKRPVNFKPSNRWNRVLKRIASAENPQLSSFFS